MGRQLPSGVHVVRLVQTHHLFVHPLAVALKLRLELLDLGLKGRHSKHGPRGVERERGSEPASP